MTPSTYLRRNGKAGGGIGEKVAVGVFLDVGPVGGGGVGFPGVVLGADVGGVSWRWWGGGHGLNIGNKTQST